MARRRSTSATARASALSPLRKARRAGVAAKRSRTSIRVPGGCAPGRTTPLRPASTVSAWPASAPAVRDAMESSATDAIEGSASPRNPSVPMRARSPSGSFEVAVALYGEIEVGGVHAASVVDDSDEPAPAAFDRHLDSPGPGIERVLDQLLHRRGRPLHHLAGGDTVDQDAVRAGGSARGNFLGRDEGAARACHKTLVRRSAVGVRHPPPGKGDTPPCDRTIPFLRRDASRRPSSVIFR